MNRRSLLRLLTAAASLPLPKAGNATLAGHLLSDRLVPGATVSWTPVVAGRCRYAVLVSEDPALVVPSEYRLVPVRPGNGFTLQVPAKAKPGTVVPMALYLWDEDRGRSVARFTLTVEAAP